MRTNKIGTLTQTLILVAAANCGLITVGCGGSPPAAVKTDTESPETWTKRTLWTEKKGDQVFVMVVGRASNASLDQTMAMDTAEQDAREHVALYLASTVQAFRERLSVLMSTKGKRDIGGGEGKAGSSAELSEKNTNAGRSIADTTVRGLEVINSAVDKDTDTQLVLGRLDIAKLREVLAQSTALSELERQRINENAQDARDAMDQALEDARRTPK